MTTTLLLINTIYMDESISGHQKAAATQPHDESGHFTTKPTLPSSTEQIKPAAKPANQQDASLDAPLVSVSINNPFSKILHWLDDIRKKQTTEFDIKLKIPLLGWAVLVGFIFGAVNVTQYLQNVQLTALLSKYMSTTKSVTVIVPTTAPTPVLISRIGVIKAAYQLNGIISPASPTEALAKKGSSASSSSNPPKPSRYLLVTSIDQMTFLTLDAGVSLTQYANKQVLVTGLYDAGTNTIHIRQSSDVQYLP